MSAEGVTRRRGPGFALNLNLTELFLPPRSPPVLTPFSSSTCSCGVSRAWRNLGQRIDYVFTNPSLTERLESITLHREFGTSDHAPLEANFEG